MPPHPLPEGLDAVPLCTEHEGPQVVLDETPDGRAAGSDRICVAQPRGPVAVGNADGDQFEVRDGPVSAVGERGGKGDAIVPGHERLDDHDLSPEFGPRWWRVQATVPRGVFLERSPAA